MHFTFGRSRICTAACQNSGLFHAVSLCGGCMASIADCRGDVNDPKGNAPGMRRECAKWTTAEKPMEKSGKTSADAGKGGKKKIPLEELHRIRYIQYNGSGQ